LFSVHTTPKKFETQQSISRHFGFVFEEVLGRESNDCRGVIVFQKHFENRLGEGPGNKVSVQPF